MSMMCTFISLHPPKNRELLIRFKLAISQFCGRLIIQYALFKTISGFRGKGHDPNEVWRLEEDKNKKKIRVYIML